MQRMPEATCQLGEEGIVHVRSSPIYVLNVREVIITRKRGRYKIGEHSEILYRITLHVFSRKSFSPSRFIRSPVKGWKNSVFHAQRQRPCEAEEP